MQSIKNKVPDGFSKEEADNLLNCLAHGSQTQERDHELLMHLVQVSLSVLHTNVESGEVQEENIVEFPGRPRMTVRLMLKPDGASEKQGHFDLVLPKLASSILAPATPDPTCALSVSHALTLRGPELAAAIFLGYKDIENRTFGMDGQWVCLHVAKSDCLPELRKQTLHLIPNLDTSNMTKGHIVGMIFVDGSMALTEYRSMVKCGTSCKFPTPTDSKSTLPQHCEGCKCSPFALGPVVNVIRKRIIFKKPIPANGSLGKWPLGTEIKQAVLRDLLEGHEVLENHGAPREWPLPWLGNGCPRDHGVKLFKDHAMWACAILLGCAILGHMKGYWVFHCVPIYKYIYIHIYTHIYIYIYYAAQRIPMDC